MYIIYNILLHVIILLLSPILLLLSLLNTFNLRQRLGFQEYACGSSEENIIWFHAASMGEVTALATVVYEIQKAFPTLRVAVSTTTVTGQVRAKKLIPSAHCIFLLPLDIPWAVSRVLRRLRPHALVLTETELWPNLIVQAHHRGCNLALINGRMSEKSVPRYRLIKGLVKHILTCLHLMCLQTERDRDRFVTLGADPERTIILGNIKFDLLRFLATLKKFDLTRESLGIAPPWKVIVAGSTRPGEEEILLSSFHKIKEVVGECVLILVPRHVDRINEIEGILAAHQFDFTVRSRIGTPKPFSGDVILVDTMGELSHLYSLGDVAFVGGSLVPLGGHNPLEPAMWGVPVLFGPHRDNIRHITELLIEEKGGIEIKNSDEFALTVLQLLQDPDERNMRGQAAQRVVEANAGVSTRTAQLLRERGIL